MAHNGPWRFDCTGNGLVQFEGIELPRSIKALGHVPFWDEFDDELMDWVMDLHYCWGRERSVRSGKLRRFVQAVRRLLLKHRAATHAHLLKAFDDLTPAKADETITEWLTTLDLMEEKARSVGVCRWTIHPTDEEIDSNLNVVVAFAEKVTGEKSDLGAKLRGLSRENQLVSLARLSDGFSQPRPGFFGRLLSRLKLRFGIRG